MRSCDIGINSARGSLNFVAGSGTYGLSSGQWYPGDEWKGDVARMIFYLHLRYDLPIEEISELNLLLSWNVEDPVSAFEDQPNTSIAGAQGNRNPFIDNPYIATLIWGGANAQDRWRTLGVDTEKLATTELYPNPTGQNYIFIRSVAGATIEIFDILGKTVMVQVMKNEKEKIELKNLHKGLYMVRISKDRSIVSRKFLKN